MKIEFDRMADAVYIRLNDKKYAYGKDLDDSRRIDYASDGTPVGIELLCVTKGVNVDNLPSRDDVIKMLEKKRIPVFA